MVWFLIRYLTILINNANDLVCIPYRCQIVYLVLNSKDVVMALRLITLWKKNICLTEQAINWNLFSLNQLTLQCFPVLVYAVVCDVPQGSFSCSLIWCGKQPWMMDYSVIAASEGLICFIDFSLGRLPEFAVSHLSSRLLEVIDSNSLRQINPFL